MTKRCSACLLDKNIIDFSQSQLKRKNTICKQCVALYNRKYREQNNDKIKIKKKEYYLDNQELLLNKQKEYAKDHVQEKYDYDKLYYTNNKTDILVQHKEYNKNNIERRRLRDQIRRENDISFRLRENLSSSIRYVIKKIGSSKNKSSFLNYVDWNIQELKEHLEKQFEIWMNWDNWGMYDPNTWDDNNSSTWTWHIDHFPRAHSTFNYTSIDDPLFKEAWSLNNLRPYPSKLNISEGNRNNIRKG